MKNLNPKPFLYLLAAYSLVVLFVVALWRGLDLRNFIDVIKLIPFVATADVVAYTVFATWLWRCKYLQGWLVPFPNLNGTWRGHIQTNWKNAHGNTPDPIPVILTIRQSFGKMSCVMRTAEMESHSFLEGFCIDREAQIRRLCYSYTSKPKGSIRDRSTPHDGTILFSIIGSPVNKLTGEYWTQRHTTGTVTLTFLTTDLLVELPSHLGPHPMAPETDAG